MGYPSCRPSWGRNRSTILSIGSIISSIAGFNDLKKGSMIQAARMGHWKAVRPALTSAVDIGEARNVAAQHPEIVREMDSFMKAAHVEPRPHNTGSFEYKQ